MTKTNPAVVGAFVVGAIGLIVFGFVMFGTAQFFTAKIPVVMYFEGSVKGLSIGAPIDFRGVPVGEVTEITGVVQEDLSIRIVVEGEIDTESVTRAAGVAAPSKPGENFAKFIAAGLRAQLETQSILTGQKFVALDFHPDMPAVLYGVSGKQAEIPTVPSDFDVLKASIEKMLAKVEELPLDQLVAEVIETVERFGHTAVAAEDFLGSVKGDTEGAISAAEATLTDVRGAITRVDAILANVQDSGLIDNTNATVVDVGGLANNVNGKVDVLTDQVKDAVASFQEASAALQSALDQAKSAMATAEAVIEPGSDVHRAVIVALNDLATAARDISDTAVSIRILTDYLGQNPESVIFGKPAGEQ